MYSKKPFFTAFHSIISVVILLFSLSLNAQTDSLQGKSYEELIQLSESALFRDANDSKTYALAANRVAKRENNQEKVGWSLYHIAYANSYILSYEEALQGIDTSIAIAENLKNNLLLFKNHNLRGNILSETEKEIEALDQYFIAKQYAELTKNPLDIITVSVNIAYIKKLHKNYQEALEILKENLDLLKQIDNNNVKKDLYQRIVLMNISDTYLRIEKTKEATYYNNLAKEKCVDETSAVCLVILMNDAIINYQNGAYEETISISQKVAQEYLKTQSENHLITPYFYLGKSYFKQKKYAKAIKYLEDAIQIATDKKIAFSDQKEVHKLLHLSYTEIGKPEKASENFKSYIELDKKNDSIDMRVTKKIHKEHDIIPLKDEIALLDTTNQKQRKRATYLYAISALLLVSLIGFFIWFKRKQHQNKIRFQQLLVTIEKLEQPKEKITPEVSIKETSSPVTDENALQILKALEVFEEKELYLRQDCTLGYVAKKAKTNTTYLSNVINTYKEKPFKSYLSELRINAALIKLKNDEKLRSYTIKAIAEEFGFKRSETFSRAFKAQTNVYPSYYIKSLQNQKDN